MNAAESDRLIRQLGDLGVRPGATVLVHSSFKALGCRDLSPAQVIDALLQAVGAAGNLLMPALSYAQQPPEVHDTRATPSNVGIIPETFRRRAGTLRSLHPTHSICGVGPDVAALFADHALDTTPCGPHSPLHKLADVGGMILMLGCGLRPNTSMHAIEELHPPVYLFGDEREYVITDAAGNRYRKRYRTHGFQGWEQRYDRIALLDAPDLCRHGPVLASTSTLIRADRLREVVLDKLTSEPTFFVDREPGADAQGLTG